MKSLQKLFILSAFVFVGNGVNAQGIYFEPSPITADQAGVKLVVDITSSECNCAVLQDADPEDNPLYIWTWEPVENRPALNGVDVLNGTWTSSNENLKMSRDDDNPNLWYFDFLGASLADFYGNTTPNVYDTGVSFLLKKKSGAGNPEQKSPDLSISIENPNVGNTEGFDLQVELFATGFTHPCDIVHSGIANDERMFVVEQTGRIRILNADASIEATPFLNLQGIVNSTAPEQGLLGLAFSPTYDSDGYFFVNYTRSENPFLTRISRFKVSDSDPNQADIASEEVVLEFVQDFDNHNGGDLEFGPDGYLYIATGDGGSGGDPNNRAQDITSHLGKMLRIDVSTLPYAIPADNPFADDDFGLDEIWAYGLRNPWKFAFDELTGDLFIADVGQSSREEVNFQAAGDAGGANYGWRCYEGMIPFNLLGCEGGDFVAPIMDYMYGNQGNGFRCSITGGRVYRGSTYGNLEGKYIAVDYCNGEYWVIWQDNGQWQVFLSPITLVGNLVGFGADKDGELYAVRGGAQGEIYRVTEACSLLSADLTLEGNMLSTDIEATQYTWLLNGVEIASTTVPSLEIQGDGTYKMNALTANGCNVSASLEVVIVSTVDRTMAKLNLYPNPARSEIRLAIDQSAVNQSSTRISVFAADGRLVKQLSGAYVKDHLVTIDVQDLPAGYYVVSLVSENAVGSAAFVKQ